MQRISTELTPDIVLIGGGIMSATLGTLLKLLNPQLSIQIFERLDQVAQESSAAWNNAGTGHSGFCELNYTSEKQDGSIDISKALKIAEEFEISKQFWSYLVQNGWAKPDDFIHSIPHMSLVHGEKDMQFLQKRRNALIQNALFENMQFSAERNILNEWIPLIMEHRNSDESIAATRMEAGADVNFEALTKLLFQWLAAQPNVTLNLQHEVRDLDKDEDGKWYLIVKDLKENERKSLVTNFVFIGAGGMAINLLEKTDIAEGVGYGGFPVSGLWLVCKNKELIEKHHAKVYGKASVGTPPMSVPHLDTRIINDEKCLLFGPYAGFSTKFLKKGSYLDLPESLRLHNLLPMISAGARNAPLTKYLVEQVMLSPEERMISLREFIPDATLDDWELAHAGQRVQIIKPDAENGGILEFGTEIVTNSEGSVAALLGASPGASTSVYIMLGLLKKCFPQQMESLAWQQKLTEMIPSWNKSLATDADLCRVVRKKSAEVLNLKV
ncbi:MAG: malate dehydrogenase (quinone) [Bacteroidetes bacterium]|nr:malate dehydrogenase (quinone) [Bacteroidota bacterium]MBS1741240.1 malate dehydrogenase (quinone) [Bacteroidota bacterium]